MESARPMEHRRGGAGREIPGRGHPERCGCRARLERARVAVVVFGFVGVVVRSGRGERESERAEMRIQVRQLLIPEVVRGHAPTPLANRL